MKKLALSAAFLSGVLVSGLSFASAAPVMAVPTFTGFFGGVDLGFRSLQVQNARTAQYTEADIFSKVKNNYTETQPTQGLNVGYGYEFANQVYLGAKLFGQIAEGSESSTGTSVVDGSSRITRTNDRFGSLFGVNGQLGYALTPRFLPYVTAGAEWLNIQASSYSDDDAGFDNMSFDKYTTGWDVGLGLKYMVTDHWLLNAEYTGAWFSSQSKTVDGTVFGVDEVYTHKITPNVFAGTVGVAYLFN